MSNVFTRQKEENSNRYHAFFFLNCTAQCTLCF